MSHHFRDHKKISRAFIKKMARLLRRKKAKAYCAFFAKLEFQKSDFLIGTSLEYLLKKKNFHLEC